MDDGSRWALETFGKYGPRIRRDVADIVRAVHAASQDAQEASGNRSNAHYGLFYVGITERFEQFAALPGATLVRPGGAPYRVPVINGFALFPWRYAKKPDGDLQSTVFAKSDARVAVAELGSGAVQGEFDLGVPDPELTDQEQRFLETLRNAADDPVVTTGRLVVVAVCSSFRDLHSVEWGEVRLTDTGRLEWAGFRESLLSLAPARPVSTSPTGTFTTGEIPPRLPRTRDAVNTQSDD